MRVLFGLMVAGLAVLPQNPIRVDAPFRELIATVRDGQGRLVHGLSAEDFRVEEDGVPQPVVQISRHTGSPVSWGILLDPSFSPDCLGASRIVVRVAGREGDEFLLMGREPEALRVHQPFTTEIVRIEGALIRLYPDEEPRFGGAPLSYESMIQRTANEMKQAQHRRRALVICASSNRFAADEAFLRHLRAMEIPVFVVVFGAGPARVEESRRNTPPSSPGQVERETAAGAALIQKRLERIAEETGGSSVIVALDVTSLVERIVDLAEEASASLHGEYRIGYYSTDASVRANPVIRIRMNSPEYRVRFQRTMTTSSSSSR